MARKPYSETYSEDAIANLLASASANSRPTSRTGQVNPILRANRLSDLESSGASNTPSSSAPSSPTAESAAVGNAIGNAVGNAVMSAVIGPIPMALASLTGHTPQSALSQIAHAIAAPSSSSGPAGVSPNGSVATGPATATDAATGDPVGVEGALAEGTSGGDNGTDGSGDGSSDGGVGTSAGNAGDADGGDGDSGDSYHTGGVVRATGKANLLANEYVLPQHVVEALGTPYLDRLVSGIPNVMGG